MIDTMIIPTKPFFVEENEALKKKVEQLEREADWLAEHRFSCCCDELDIKRCKHFSYGLPPQDAVVSKDCIKCWREAARKVVRDD